MFALHGFVHVLSESCLYEVFTYVIHVIQTYVCVMFDWINMFSMFRGSTYTRIGNISSFGREGARRVKQEQ